MSNQNFPDPSVPGSALQAAVPPAAPTVPPVPPVPPYVHAQMPPYAQQQPAAYGEPQRPVQAYGQQQYPVQAYGQSQYMAPAYPMTGYAVASPTNGLALASMICGIVGVLGSPFIFFFFLPIVLPIAAVILGHIARSQIKKNPLLGGKGMALAGLIMGYVPLALSVLGLVLLVIAFLIFGSLLSLPAFM